MSITIPEPELDDSTPLQMTSITPMTQEDLITQTGYFVYLETNRPLNVWEDSIAHNVTYLHYHYPRFKLYIDLESRPQAIADKAQNGIRTIASQGLALRTSKEELRVKIAEIASLATNEI